MTAVNLAPPPFICPALEAVGDQPRILWPLILEAVQFVQLVVDNVRTR